MIVFNINHNDYKLMLRDLATVLDIQHNGNDFLVLTEPTGSGILNAFSLFDELQVLLVNATFNDRLLLTRERSDKRWFILHFDDVFITDTVKFSVDGEMLQKTNTRHAVARLTSNIFTNSEEIPAHLPIRSVKILFNENWLGKYLGLNQDDHILQKYLSLKTESFDIEKLDTEYLRLMDEMWRIQKNDPLQNISLQNRVALLMERFFTRLYGKMNLLDGKFKLTDDEIERLIKVEQLLVSDFSELPPTIDEFSRLVSMSSTKLKNSFKGVYGDSIYAYYQKLRMQKARELLMTGNYNVKAAGEAIGYTNTSNFILAFKKYFNISPGEVLNA